MVKKYLEEVYKKITIWESYKKQNKTRLCNHPIKNINFLWPKKIIVVLYFDVVEGRVVLGGFQNINMIYINIVHNKD